MQDKQSTENGLQGGRGTARDNPVGTDGFGFVEFASPEPEQLARNLEMLGFVPVARHRRKQVVAYRQGACLFLLDDEPGSYARAFAAAHGPSVCGMAFRVADPAQAHSRALSLGAQGIDSDIGGGAISIPALAGVGGTRLSLVNHSGNTDLLAALDFEPLPNAGRDSGGAGLLQIDHMTHNVHRGQMDTWAHFYERIFDFREIRYFDIEGQQTGLVSRAMASPCGKIRIPINESSDDKSQIEEYLREYKGEGIQHIAFSTADIYHSVDTLRRAGVSFLSTSDAYYDAVDARVPGHGEDLARLRADGVLIDGVVGADGLLLQIFTETMIGPIFFEIIQRKGNQGFGEGNFRALFEAMEQDQIRRGTL